MKIGCVIQGDIRIPIDQVIDQIRPQVDLVVLSTWPSNESPKCLSDIILLENQIPRCRGVSNRNLQRLSTANGIKVLREMGCDFVLKWRTDLIPTRLSIEKLIRLSQDPSGDSSKNRIVISAFRTLSVTPDWFSSFPDLFSFSSIEDAEMLWGDDEFDYRQQFNVPVEMENELGFVKSSDGLTIEYKNRAYRVDGATFFYDSHTEMYAIFKSRYQRKNQIKVNHSDIIKNKFQLIDDDCLQLVWPKRDRPLSYRPTRIGFHVKWWRPNRATAEYVYQIDEMEKINQISVFERAFYSLPVRIQILQQMLWYILFMINRNRKLLLRMRKDI